MLTADELYNITPEQAEALSEEDHAEWWECYACIEYGNTEPAYDAEEEA